MENLINLVTTNIGQLKWKTQFEQKMLRTFQPKEVYGNERSKEYAFDFKVDKESKAHMVFV